MTVRGDAWPGMDRIRAAADALTGDILQRPGAYSAVKQGGTPLYRLARAGKAAEAPLRQVHIESITLQGETPRHGVMMTVVCGRGTYIRSLCEDIGRLCGCPAHMRFLLRARSGAFGLETAVTLEEAAAMAEAGTLAEALIAPDVPLRHLPALQVPPRLWKAARCGTALPAEAVAGADALPEAQPARVYAGDAFLGIACRTGSRLAWRMVMADSTQSTAPRAENTEQEETSNV